MSLLSITSLFFGLTLIYTGFLLASANHMAAGIGASFAGLLLCLRPILDAARFLRGHSMGGASPRTLPRNATRRARPKKVYLKIVKSEDDKPTIH